MAEKVDIYNDRLEHVGVEDKEEVHKKGLWHKVFICLLIDPKKNTALLQRKVDNYYDFDRPDYVDFTVGGHFQAGESVEQSIRELKEEIGVEVGFSDLVPLGIRQTAHTVTDTFIEYEFQHIFLLPSDRQLESFMFEGVEVKNLVEVDIQDCIDLLLGKTDKIQAEAISIIEGKKITESIKLSQDEFVPSYIAKDQIFLKLFIAAKRYIRGESPDEILI